MATLPAGEPGLGNPRFVASSTTRTSGAGRGRAYKRWAVLAAAVLVSSLAIAQSIPQVTGVDPAAGKVNDTVTVSGSNLGKTSVSSVFLSDDKSDFKAAIVDQGEEKITMKVPQVKAGDYNVSIQVGDKLFIKPVKFKVQE